MGNDDDYQEPTDTTVSFLLITSLTTIVVCAVLSTCVAVWYVIYFKLNLFGSKVRKSEKRKTWSMPKKPKSELSDKSLQEISRIQEKNLLRLTHVGSDTRREPDSASISVENKESFPDFGKDEKKDLVPAQTPRTVVEQPKATATIPRIAASPKAPRAKVAVLPKARREVGKGSSMMSIFDVIDDTPEKTTVPLSKVTSNASAIVTSKINKESQAPKPKSLDPKNN